MFIELCYNYSYYFSRFVYVPSPHMKDVHVKVLVDCFLEWNINRKLSTITVDNCSTNDVMIRLLLNKLDTNSLMLGDSMLHMRCTVHILNLIVQDELSLIGDGKWNIDRKLSIITVDNYSTNDVMIRLLLNKFDTSSLMLSGYVLYIRCAEHILNFIVQDELSLIGDAIERIHDSVIY